MRYVSPIHLKQAAQAIHRGGVVAYPTEAVFGLGCAPDNVHGVLRILELKHRPMEKGLILIASRVKQLMPYVDLDQLPATTRETILTSWPGPVTWLLPVKPDTPAWLTGDHTTLAVRVTAHPVAAALCEQLGHALVSTSANHAGQPPARHRTQAKNLFGRQLDYILAGQCGPQTRPTEIRDALTNQVVRA